MRWFLIDEFVEIRKGISAKSRSRFPDFEFSPEVLLIEMMAQTGGVILGAENNYKDDVVFAKIESAEFPTQGVPGEVIEIMATVQNLRQEGGWIEGVIQNSRSVLAKAKIMLANAGALVPGKTESTTFHEKFMNHFKIREKIK